MKVIEIERQKVNESQPRGMRSVAKMPLPLLAAGPRRRRLAAVSPRCRRWLPQRVPHGHVAASHSVNLAAVSSGAGDTWTKSSHLVPRLVAMRVWTMYSTHSAQHR